MIGIDPLYFLDEMSIDEINAIYKAKDEHERQSWEQARLISYYSVVSMNGNKDLKNVSDLFKFPWEKKNK